MICGHFGSKKTFWGKIKLGFWHQNKLPFGKLISLHQFHQEKATVDSEEQRMQNGRNLALKGFNRLHF